MNNDVGELILELAERLGTTGEHLWGVLVRQAPISGAIDLTVMAAWVLAVAWAFRVGYVEETSSGTQGYYYGKCL